MRLNTNGAKLYRRRNVEGFSVKQIQFATSIKRELQEDAFLRYRLGELSEVEVEALQKAFAHTEAGWWIQREHWSVWRLIREQAEANRVKGAGE